MHPKGLQETFAQLCELGRQMVMVTKVYKPKSSSLMVEKLEQNSNDKLWMKHVCP